jgi:hypothetical protein
MDIATAIGRLNNRDHYLKEQIEKRPEKSHWMQMDIEAIALAISALVYLRDIQEYEASQAPR